MTGIGLTVKYKKSMNKFKLFIMAAGLGTRNTHHPNLHKALLPLDNLPAISYILNNVSVDVEIVIAVGHLKDQLISFLNYTYPERKFTFVFQNPYQGENIGPAHAVLAAKEELKCPFIITTCDTIVPSKVQHVCPTRDWIGVDKAKSISYSCFINGKLIRQDVPPIYIGVAGVHNWQNYIESLETKNTRENTDGFSEYELVPFNWKDTGSDQTYALLDHSSIVPEKPDQVIFIVNGKVIKYWNDSHVAENVYRVAKRLNHSVEKINDHMIGYDYIEGSILSDYSHDLESITNKIFSMMITDPIEADSNFEDRCKAMYEDKTRQRVAKFLEKYPEVDKISTINGVHVKPIEFYLNNIPWDYINKTSVPSSKFHGDVQPENIIIQQNSEPVFIDWRSDFGGTTEYGDMYYDFGKLWHDLIVSNSNILQKKFSICLQDESASISIALKDNLISILKYLEYYSKRQEIDWEKIEILGSIQYISIACLYDDPHFSKFLFLLGKLCLESLHNGIDFVLEKIKMELFN